ncbi:MAG: STAS domain-containing protein [Chromatiaceae bacterium]|nr:STAS domain-containing protein [Gammaproteobacteria bacterium]MCP5306919.1 STAS domain-containing protein [Chromatiaceae bacterium]
MSITSSVSSDGAVVTIYVTGHFDFASHQEFMRAYKQHPRGEKSFVVDLKHAEYMDSSAMGALLQLREYGVKGRPTEVVNSSDGVREILRIANFDKIFKIS